LHECASWIFERWDKVRKGMIKRSTFKRELPFWREQVSEMLRWGTTCDHSKTRGACEEILKLEDALWTFAYVEGVEPTNNLAEQALRFVVIDRRITQGTRGVAGRQWCERIWTTITTCSQQGRSVFEFLQEAVHAHFAGRASPSLLPDFP